MMQSNKQPVVNRKIAIRTILAVLIVNVFSANVAKTADDKFSINQIAYLPFLVNLASTSACPEFSAYYPLIKKPYHQGNGRRSEVY